MVQTKAKLNIGSWLDTSVARVWNDYGTEIPTKYVEENRKKFGEITNISLGNPVRNTNWEWLHFKNPDVFRPAAVAFEQSEQEVKGTSLEPKYCPHVRGTQRYATYWTEERRRCIEGYEPIVNGKPCGLKISGEYYFYLNYCRIKQIGKNESTGETTEVVGFPTFCQMDYYYFMELDARENPHKYGLPASYKKSIILAKARRLGFSYKNAGGATYKYTFYKNVKVCIVSQKGEKAVETFEKCLDNIDFLTKYTEFGGPHIRRSLNKQSMKGSIKAGTTDKKGNEKGRKSEIYTVSLNKRADAAAGGGCVRVIFEEAGMVKDLAKAWSFTEPTLRSGKLYKGIGIVFGTGGEMTDKSGKAGASQNFSMMFNDPKAYKFGEYTNIYEFGEDGGTCGLFFNIAWFREGAEFVTPEGKKYSALDGNGNIRAWVAEIDLNMERKDQIDKDKDAYETELTQYCKTPREAFLQIKGSVFPVAEIEARLERLLTTDDLRYLSTVGTLAESNGEVIFRPDVERKLKPIDRFPTPPKTKYLDGGLVIYEQPRKVNGVIPYGAYIATIDPIGIDSSGGESLSAIYIVKTGMYPLDIGYDEIVAEYVGRSSVDPIDNQNHMLYKMAKYYNAAVTHENDRTGKEVRTFFLDKNAYQMLMPPPSDIVSEHIPNSKTNLRKTGHSMSSERMKEIGELYLKRWLLKSRGFSDEDGKEITNLDKIRSVALLQELQGYSRSGNFDRVLSLIGAILQMRQLESNFARNGDRTEESMDYFTAQINKYYSKTRDDSPYLRENVGMTDSRLKYYN